MSSLDLELARVELAEIFALKSGTGKQSGVEPDRVTKALLGCSELLSLLRRCVGARSVEPEIALLRFVSIALDAADQRDHVMSDDIRALTNASFREAARGYLYLARWSPNDRGFPSGERSGQGLSDFERVVGQSGSTNIDDLRSVAARSRWAVTRQRRALNPNTEVRASERIFSTIRDSTAAIFSADLIFAAQSDEIMETFRRTFESGPEAFLRGAVSKWDVAPSYYPQSMLPSSLGKSMQARPLSELIREKTSASKRLYSVDLPSSGGSNVVETILNSKRTIVLGDPGCGKSTILAAAVMQWFEFSGSSRGAVVRLSDLVRFAADLRPKTAREAATVVAETLTDLYRSEEVSEAEKRSLRDLILFDDAFLLALDGLDEVNGWAEKHAIDDLLRCLNGLPGRLVVSSRLTGYKKPHMNASEWVVSPLQPTAARDFMGVWYQAKSDKSGLDRAYEALDNSSQVRDLVRIPLMAGLVAFVAEKGSVPQVTSLLYERYLALFFERGWKHPEQQRSDPIGDARRITTLRREAKALGWAMATTCVEEDGSLIREEWTDVLSYYEILELPGLKRSRVRVLLTIDGLLTLHSGSVEDFNVDKRYRWLHRTIHEHLAGAYLADLLVKDRHIALSQLLMALQLPSIWRVTLDHFIELLDSRQQMLVMESIEGWIVQGDPGGYLRQGSNALLPLLSERIRLDARWNMGERLRSALGSTTSESETDELARKAEEDGLLPWRRAELLMNDGSG